MHDLTAFSVQLYKLVVHFQKERLALLGPALLEVLLLGFPALGFPDSARVKCGGSFEMESRALLPVDGGGEPFSGRRNE